MTSASCDMPGGNVGRPSLVSKAVVVEPGAEKHLHRAAAEPVALLIIRADAADAGAEALWDKRRKRLVAARGHGQLPLCRRGAADQADLVRRPGQPAHPVERIVGIGERHAENVVVAFGEVAAALVHLDVGVAVLDRFQCGGHVARRAQTRRPSS